MLKACPFNSQPLVTIVTPSFNQGRYIAETIESVLAQTYPSIELIVIDGGSSDETNQVVSKYRSKLKIYVSEPDSGQTSAINKGLRLAEGRYAMWLNSDDILLPNAIADMVKIFEQQPSVDLCHGQSILFSDPSKKTYVTGAEDKFEDKYAAYMSFPQPSSSFRMSALKEVGFLDETLHYAMDFDFYIRIYLKGDFFYCPKVFSKYRLHQRSKSNNGLSFVNEWREVFSRFLNSTSLGKKIRNSFQEWGLHSGTQREYLSERIIEKFLFEKIVFNHLFVCASFLYRYGDDKGARMYLSYIKKFFPSQYEARSTKQLYFRSYLIPKALRGLRDPVPR